MEEIEAAAAKEEWGFTFSGMPLMKEETRERKNESCFLGKRERRK